MAAAAAAAGGGVVVVVAAAAVVVGVVVAFYPLSQCFFHISSNRSRNSTVAVVAVQ